MTVQMLLMMRSFVAWQAKSRSSALSRSFTTWFGPCRDEPHFAKLIAWFFRKQRLHVHPCGLPISIPEMPSKTSSLPVILKPVAPMSILGGI